MQIAEGDLRGDRRSPAMSSSNDSEEWAFAYGFEKAGANAKPISTATGF
jgi:hypothetical protein